MTRFHLPQRSASYCAILTLACASALCARELRLDTATDVTLLLPARPASASRFAPNPTVFTTDVDLEEALEDLREGLLRRCGARATVRSEIPTTPGVVVHIGRTALAESLVPDLDALDLEGFVLRTEGSNLLLAGRTPLGTRHAIYTFLERHCGIRWFFPHPLGTLVPETSPLVLPEFDERHQPAFLSRYFTLHRQPGKETWERRNKGQNHWSNRLKGNSHAMAAIFPAGTFAAEHPEVYALVQGKRRLPGGNVPEARAAYCLSNPEVADRCIAWLLAYFAKHPQAASVSMAMNDTSVTCDCADCRSRGVDGTTRSLSTSLRFVQRGARASPPAPKQVIGVPLSPTAPCRPAPRWEETNVTWSPAPPATWIRPIANAAGTCWTSGRTSPPRSASTPTSSARPTTGSTRFPPSIHGSFRRSCSTSAPAASGAIASRCSRSGRSPHGPGCWPGGSGIRRLRTMR